MMYAFVNLTPSVFAVNFGFMRRMQQAVQAITPAAQAERQELLRIHFLTAAQ